MIKPFPNKKTKRIFIDMFINICGTGIPLAILQLVIYPIVAKKVSDDAYGEMQSIMSFLYLIAGTLGGTLSTTRLVLNQEYKEKKLLGDFNFLFLANSIVLFISIPILIKVYINNISFLSIVLTTVLALLIFSVNYLEVGFRLELNFKKMFLAKAITGVGYFAGYLLFCVTLQWQWIFVISYAITGVYCLFRTNIIKETLRRTRMLKKTSLCFGNLTVATALSKSQTYFDKLLLYPLMGGASVSIYFAANIFGKLIIQVLEPITNVFLSYISKHNTIGKSIWMKVFAYGSVFCVGMYFVCLAISEPILTIFYPQWVAAAKPLIPVATASLCVASFFSIIYPLTLKMLRSYLQIVINGLSIVVYIVLVLLLYSKLGLMGCCVALLVSYCVKLAIAIILFLGSQNETKLFKFGNKTD